MVGNIILGGHIQGRQADPDPDLTKSQIKDLMKKREDITQGRAPDQTIISDEDKAIPDRLKKDDMYTKPNLNLLSTPGYFYPLSPKHNINHQSLLSIIIIKLKKKTNK